MALTITHIDTACILIDINGYKIMTDPTLDSAGKLYHHGFGAFSRKTDNPALQNVSLDTIDLVLLSHHQHKDNFDTKGKAFTLTAPLVITTKPAAKTLPNAIGLDDWQKYSIDTPKVPGLKITATPAQHRPSWVPEFVSGKVTGFIIEHDGQQNGVLYLSGDTVFFWGIEAVAIRYRVDIAVLNVGAVQFRYLTGMGLYTMNAMGMLRAVQILQPNHILPIHSRGWTHFKEKEDHLHQIVQQSPLAKKITWLLPGMPTFIP
jgi:L-ascorbate metabolism protein UlaG (beta-lactamase superfamily)